MLMQLRPKAKVLQEFCKSRIGENRNIIILITGDTGTGKTLAAFRIGVDFDPHFSHKYITQDADNVLKLFSEIAKNKDKHTGRVIIYEETQEDMLNLNATTIESKAIIKLFSKFRYLNGIFIMTTPRSGHLNKLLMDYVDIHLSTEQIFRKRKICRLRIKFGRWVEAKQKMFWEYMRVQYKNGKTYSDMFQLRFIDLLIPPKNVIDFYEHKKDTFFIESMDREKKRIDRKHGRTDTVRFPQYCGICKYTWKSLKEKPLKCPRCMAILQEFTRTRHPASS